MTIKIHKLSKKYGSLNVLDEMDLEIFDGETLVILGRSGIGKSVLLKQILGIESSDSGYIEIDGKKISDMNKKELLATRKTMGMLFQNAALFDSLTVRENVAFYLNENEKQLGKQEIAKRTAEALAMVNLAGSEDKMPSELSGGMKKRVALARMIIYEPSILLFDEPTTGLDPTNAMNINDLIIEIKKKFKQCTAIVVTHDIVTTVKIADRIAFLDEGKIVHIAPASEFFHINDPRIKAFYKNATLSQNYLIERIQGDPKHV